MASKRARPAVDGLYERDAAGRTRLITSRCGTCGARAFPARDRCADCLGTDLEPVRCGPDGELYAFTFVHEAFGRGSLPPPYGVAKVRFDDGFTVQGLMDPSADGWRIGMPVETTEIVLEQDGEVDLYTYAFRPGESHNA